MKVDLKRELDSYCAERGEFRVLDVPAAQYLMIDGNADPNTAQAYADALAALYPVAYRLKFASKVQLDRDYVVMPPRGAVVGVRPEGLRRARQVRVALDSHDHGTQLDHAADLRHRRC